MPIDEMLLYALGRSRSYGEKLGVLLGVSLSPHEERSFEDGEHKARPLASVRGKDVFVVQSLFSDPEQSVNDKLCRMLFFIGALRDASAERVTAVVPYLCYARKDRKTQPRDPVTTRYLAALFEAVGVDRVLTLDVHNLAAFQNAFRCRTEHLETTHLFARYFADLVHGKELAVVSPDVGGVKRAERLRTVLSKQLDRPVASAFMEKYRGKGLVRGDTLVGEVRGREVIILDDLISTGTTMARAAHACRQLGATRVYAAAAHGLFVGQANTVFANSVFDKVVITDTVPPFRLTPELVAKKLILLETTHLVAEAIQRLHTAGSIVELLES